VFFEDLAKGIATWQVAQAKVPRDLSDLLAALNARIARLAGMRNQNLSEDNPDSPKIIV
jgi:hypothetical protein